MSEANYTIERDLTEAKALADHLVPYVYEDQLYGSIGGMFGSGSMPSLTIGALLLRLHRLHALEGQLSDAQKTELASIDGQNESARKEWSVHYDGKLVQEATSRLKMMDRYFADCIEDPRSCATNYPPEALRRTVVAAIVKALAHDPAASGALGSTVSKIDSKLHRFAQPSDFLWASALEAAYPQSEYWWLYARPPRAAK